MFLFRLTLNLRHPRTRGELERPYEIHRTLSKAWDRLEPAQVLFRADQDRMDEVSVVVQSLIPPDWSRLTAQDGYLLRIDGPKELNLQNLKPGQKLRFRLRCNPSKRIGAKADKEFGKRKTLGTKQEIMEWLT